MSTSRTPTLWLVPSALTPTCIRSPDPAGGGWGRFVEFTPEQPASRTVMNAAAAAVRVREMVEFTGRSCHPPGDAARAAGAATGACGIRAGHGPNRGLKTHG